MIAVRVLMSIAGGLGLLGAAFFALAFGVPDVQQSVEESLGSGAESDAFLVGLIIVISMFAGYGIISLTFVLLMGKRSLVLYGLLIAFQAVILLTSLVSLAAGGGGSLFPVIFAGLLLGLILNKPSLAYYRGYYWP